MISGRRTHHVLRQVGAGVAAFALLSLIGPAVRLLVPYAAGGDFVYSLVLALWPAQPLAVVEASVGTAAALAIAVGANVVVFALIGLVAGLVLVHRTALRILELAVLFGVLLVVFRWAGMRADLVNLSAMAVAGVCYAATFEWLIRRPRYEAAA